MDCGGSRHARIAGRRPYRRALGASVGVSNRGATARRASDFGAAAKSARDRVARGRCSAPSRAACRGPAPHRASPRVRRKLVVVRFAGASRGLVGVARRGKSRGGRAHRGDSPGADRAARRERSGRRATEALRGVGPRGVRGPACRDEALRSRHRVRGGTREPSGARTVLARRRGRRSRARRARAPRARARRRRALRRGRRQARSPRLDPRGGRPSARFGGRGAQHRRPRSRGARNTRRAPLRLWAVLFIG